jgi:hypothetical protein
MTEHSKSSGRASAQPANEKEGPLGDILPGRTKDPRTGGGQPQEDVEDRPVVGRVTPEDYPENQRNKG